MASKGIPEKFHPPVTLILPKRMFGSKKVERAFRANWCQQFPWLHYNIDRDAAFCHVCMQADNEGKFLSSSKRESSFITDGFTNWKEATCSFRSHQQSKFHLEAVIIAQYYTTKYGSYIDIEKLLWPRPSRTNAELLPPPLLDSAVSVPKKRLSYQGASVR